MLDTPPKQNGRPLLFQCMNTLHCVFHTLCLLINALDVASPLVMPIVLLINALDVASPLVMPIVFIYLQLHSGKCGRLALSYLQFV